MNLALKIRKIFFLTVFTLFLFFLFNGSPLFAEGEGYKKGHDIIEENVQEKNLSLSSQEETIILDLQASYWQHISQKKPFSKLADLIFSKHKLSWLRVINGNNLVLYEKYDLEVLKSEAAFYKIFQKERNQKRTKEEFIASQSDHGTFSIVTKKVRVLLPEDSFEDIYLQYVYNPLRLSKKALFVKERESLSKLWVNYKKEGLKKEFLVETFSSIHIPLLASILIILGGLFLLIANTRQKNRDFSKVAGDEENDLDERTFSDTQEFRAETEPNPFSSLNSNVLSVSEENESEIPDSDTYKGDAELWNLPNFQFTDFSPQESIRKQNLSLVEQFYGLKKDSDFQFYLSQNENIPRAKQGIYERDLGSEFERGINIESFAKSVLEELRKYIPNVESILYLRNASGNFEGILKKKANFFISGDSIDNWQISEKMTKKLAAGYYISSLSDNKQQYLLPLLSSEGLMGFIFVLESYSTDEKINWENLLFELNRYGKMLLHAFIYEQATSDKESSLLNSMRFRDDLWQHVSMSSETIHKWQLLLFRFSSKTKKGQNTGAEDIDTRLYGTSLRRVFPLPARAYRITANICAVITPSYKEPALQKKLKLFSEYCNQEKSTFFHLGTAKLSEEIRHPREWFGRAEKALNRAEKDKKIKRSVFSYGREQEDLERV